MIRKGPPIGLLKIACRVQYAGNFPEAVFRLSSIPAKW